MPDTNIRAATDGDADVAAAVLAEAFDADPVMSWLIPNATRRRAALATFYGLEARHRVLRHGDSWMAVADGSSAGAALVLPPDQWRSSIGDQLSHGGSFASVFRRRLPHALLLETRMERVHPREPHYYLLYVGVRPAMAGQGIGSLLLKQLASRCDSEGLPAYLEASSPDNARLYRRHGFKTLDVLCVRDCPPLELMWRDSK